MASPTYSTDLTLLTDAESAGTWVELTNFALGGIPASDAENFIQGSECFSQGCGNKTGVGFSVVFNNGSGVSLNAGDVFLIWHYFAVPEALYTKANAGIMLAIHSTLTAGDLFYVGGRDYGRNPYGGWANFVVDPAHAEDDTDTGGGNGGTYQYIGAIVSLSVKISKGTPHAVDAIRHGRGEIKAIDGESADEADFSILAEYNDYNQAGAHPNSGDADGYNRFGLFSYQGGVYLWKGLMSLGDVSNAVDFLDANKTIIVDDTEKVYAAFNRIEINNAGSSVVWINISITALGTQSPGGLEVIDSGADVLFTGCVFSLMGIFAFLPGSILTSCVFNSCGQITHGDAVFFECGFEGYEGSVDTGYMIYNGSVDGDGELDGCVFTKGAAATHAIEFGIASPTDITLRDVLFVDYNVSDNQTDSAILIRRDSGTVNISIAGIIGNTPTYKSLGATVIITNTKTLTVTCKNEAGNPLEGVNVRIEKVSDGSLISEGSTNASGQYVDSTYAFTSELDVKIIARIIGKKFNAAFDTITANGLSVPFTMIKDPTVNLP